jgi:hypothetical protein
MQQDATLKHSVPVMQQDRLNRAVLVVQPCTAVSNRTAAVKIVKTLKNKVSVILVKRISLHSDVHG